MHVRQRLAFIGILGLCAWMTLGAMPASAQNYGQRPPPPGAAPDQMDPDDSQGDDQQPPPPPPGGRPPGTRPPGYGPPPQGVLPPPGGRGRPDGLRARMFELRNACQAGDRRACVQFGIIIGENRDRRGQWRRDNPDFFWWER